MNNNSYSKRIDTLINVLIGITYNLNPFEEQGSQPLRASLSEKVDITVSHLMAVLFNLSGRHISRLSPAQVIELSTTLRDLEASAADLDRLVNLDTVHGPVNPAIIITLSRWALDVQPKLASLCKVLGVSEDDYQYAV